MNCSLQEKFIREMLHKSQLTAYKRLNSQIRPLHWPYRTFLRNKLEMNGLEGTVTYSKIGLTLEMNGQCHTIPVPWQD